MSELKAKRIKMVYNGEVYDDFGTVPCTQLYYRKSEADAVIADLQKTNVMLADNAVKLNRELESLKASHYAEMVDAGMEIRRLKRALYKACANWAHAERSFALVLDFKYPENWDEMERKCRAKEEKYK